MTTNLLSAAPEGDEVRVLFIGDSITDAGRDRNDGSNLGSGYPYLIAAWYNALHPETNVSFFNRGLSGNRVSDLKARWKNDCLNLRPTLVSILIGINDTWRRYDSGEITSTEDFERDYRTILDSTRSSLDARLVLCEPFLLPVPADRRAWRVDLDPRIHVVRQLALEYDAVLVPLDGIFAQAAAARRDLAFWLPDGVHPAPAGHALIAQSWLHAVTGS
jgi:acyl-CoA thioesterase I